MNLHKCTEIQKLDNLKETWDAEVVPRRGTTYKYMFAFFVFVLFYVIQVKCLTFILKQSLILLGVCLVVVKRPWSEIHTKIRIKFIVTRSYTAARLPQTYQTVATYVGYLD